MQLSWFDITLIIAYFLSIIAIGFWARRKETTKEFLIAGRKVGVWQTTASIVAVSGGMALVGQAALAYDMGFGTMWLWLGFAAGIALLGAGAKKIKKFADKHNFLTISQYLFSVFDKKSGILAASIFFLAFFALLTGQFIAGASLFGPFFGISYELSVMLLGATVLIYLLLGGFKAVIKTDFLQFFIMVFIFFLIMMFVDVGSYEPTQLFAVGGANIILFFVMGIFIVLGGADIWQRVFASADIKTVKRASYLSAIFFLLFGFTLTLVGIAARHHFPNLDPSQAMYYGFFELLPAPLVGIAVIVVLAAIMSTIDTELFLLSSSIAKDFQKFNDKKASHTIKVTMVILALISMCIAIFVSQILTILFGIVSLILAVSPAILAAMFWNPKKNAIFLSLIGGVLGFLVLIVLGEFTPDTAAIALPAAIIFLLAGQVLCKK